MARSGLVVRSSGVSVEELKHGLSPEQGQLLQGWGCGRGLGLLAASWPHHAGGKGWSWALAGSQAQIQGTEWGDLVRVLLQQEVAGLPDGGVLGSSCPGLKPPRAGGPLRGGDRWLVVLEEEPRPAWDCVCLSSVTKTRSRTPGSGEKCVTSKGWMPLSVSSSN